MTAAVRLGLVETEALRDCAVMINVSGDFCGSGFLVAPGLAVTAAHVLAAVLDPGFSQYGAPVSIRHAADEHPVAAEHIRLAPEKGDGGKYHPFPDLALLTVPGWTGHPVAGLARTEAEPDSALTALGYSTYTPAAGPRPDTLALRVVGRSADFVRVLGDGIRDGHSGSMLVGADGLVRGVLKGTRSYQHDEGGWFTPVGALAALLDAAGVVTAAAGPVHLPPPTDAELVTVLLAFPLLRRLAGRFDLLDTMGEHLELAGPFEVEERADSRAHLLRIVRRCHSFRDGRSALRALYTALADLAPDDGALDELRPLIERAVGGAVDRRESR
ncbi:trypsin-like peptidase domain-containing protein [Kitasatospora sp. NPDC093806]|uniref:effector-associated domain 2-containing protein n=1 Tax=Kitasatospora sp. NPDC093806 TaxID=3155075 RepID=UPI003447F1CC